MKYGFLRIYLATLGVIVHRIRHYRALHLLLDLSAVVVLPATGRTMMDRGGARTGAVVDVFIGFIVAPFSCRLLLHKWQISDEGDCDDGGRRHQGSHS